MSVFRRGRNSNRYTLISIVIILIALCVYRYTMPQKAADYPEYIHYRGGIYQYFEAVKSSPVLYKRLWGLSDEGYLVLARRGRTSSESLNEIYIYKGFMQYRKYVIKNE